MIVADQVSVLECIRPNFQMSLPKYQALTGENSQKGLFFKVFDKIKGVRLEITN